MTKRRPNESFHRIAYAPGELCVGEVERLLDGRPLLKSNPAGVIQRPTGLYVLDGG